MMTVLRCVTASVQSLVKVERRLTGRYLWLLGLCGLLLAGVWYVWQGARAGQAAPPVAPRSLASADFDGDGVADVVSGYALADGTGRVALQRGVAYSTDTKPEDFLATPGREWAAPLSPDFIGAGDFNADGHADLVLGARGGTKLIWWAGDGRGGFVTAGASNLSGGLTALAVGEVNRPDGLPEVVLGVATPDGAGQVLVWEGPNGAGQATTEVFATNAPVSGLALGALDGDAMPDVAVTAGRALLLIAGRDRKLSLRAEEQATVRAAQISVRSFPTALRDVALGEFTGDGRLDAAVLTADGAVQILRQPATKRGTQWAAWQAEETSAPGGVWAGVQRLVTVRVTGLPVSSVIGVGGDGATARLLKRETTDGATALTVNGRLRLNATRWAEAELEGMREEPERTALANSSGSSFIPHPSSLPLAAVLPLRINGDALDDLVVLRPGATAPMVLPSAPAAIFTVNSSADTDDGVCTAAHCTLREALNAANANAGLDEVRFNIPAGALAEGEPRDGLGAATGKAASLESGLTNQTLTAEGDLDAGFNPVVASGGQVRAVALQSDGKVIVGGYFTSFNGVQRGRIARLNEDGTLDTTFGNGVTGVEGSGVVVFAVAIQPDGKIIIGGSFGVVNGVGRQRIARLNSDGTIDTSFGNGLSGVAGSGGENVSAIAVQPDGKIVIGGFFANVNGLTRNNIARLNADGSTDTSFGNGLSGASSSVNALGIQNNKIIIGGRFGTVNGIARSLFARLNEDGSLDTTFGSGQTSGSGVGSLAVQADGKVVLGGDSFSVINGVPRGNVARLNADGSLDTTFGNGLSGISNGIKTLAVQADGKVILGGDFTTVNGATRGRIVRLNTDGSTDTGFGSGLTGFNVFGNVVFSLGVRFDNKVVIGGQFRAVNGLARNNFTQLNADGSTDVAFSNGLSGPGESIGGITFLALQSDGKILTSGGFLYVNGVARGRIARLNADGTLDTSFANGLSGADGFDVRAVALQPDGKVVMGGFFTTVNGVARGNIARLNADGTLDTGFGNSLSGTNNSVDAVALQSDGKVVMGGSFSTVNGVARSGIARLNGDGTLDTSFGNGLATDLIVAAVALQPDGKVVMGGSFTTVNGVARGRIARLNGDGTLDTGFANGLSGANSFVEAVALQADGKVVLGGGFTTLNGVARGRIARLNGDGTLDTGFGNSLSGTNNGVDAVALQPDGKVVMGGSFSTVNGVARSGIARLNGDGTLDTSFANGQSGTNSGVRAVVVQLDGKVVMGGSFSTVNGVARSSIARLLSGASSLRFNTDAFTANENAGAALLTVIREGSTGPAALNFATTAGGTATGGSSCSNGVDYLNTSGTLTWADGETGPKSFAIPLCDDTLAEGNETVNVALSNPAGAILGAPNQAVLTIVNNTCAYAISPTSQNVLASGGNGFFTVTAGAGCPWTAASNAPEWLSLGEGSTGNGNGTVAFTAQPNTGPARTGTILVAGQTFSVIQDGGAGCSYQVGPPLSRRFEVAGGNGAVNVFSVPGTCPWTATSNNPSFLTVTAGASGTGSGQVTFAVSSNTTGSARAGTITISGGANFTRILTVVQGFDNGNRRTITLNSPLPQILDPIVIDGSTQPGFAGVPLIEINGQNLAAQGGGDGLVLTAGNSTVRSLILNRFGSATSADSALVLITNGNNMVEGCYVGSNTSGANSFTPAPQRDSAVGISIRSSSDNRIGGTTVAQRNLISGVDGRGLVIANAATGNLVQGNYIGPDITGNVSLGFQSTGVNIRNASGNTLGGTAAGAGNLISGNLEYGVFLESDAQNNLVQGNIIGANGTAQQVLANNNAGVFLYRPSGLPLTTMNTVGGTTPAARNVISGNDAFGVVVGAGATATLVQGNYIGTDAAGSAAVPNAHGLSVTQATGSAVGGAVPGARNVISGNRFNGVFLGALNNGQTGSVGATVQNNYIGTNAAGETALANGRDGVFVEVQCVSNTVAENLIAYNGANGIRIPNLSAVPGAPAFRINLRDNAIHSNAQLGIDLGPEGVTPNDPGDPDDGANLLQNFPVLTGFSAPTILPGKGRAAPTVAITVTGMLPSSFNSVYTIHWYFSNTTTCVNNQNGNPLAFGRIPGVRTDANGNATYSFPLEFPPGVTSGMVNATATDPNGNTSEFGACQTVSAPPATNTFQFNPASYNTNEALGQVILTVTRSGNLALPATIDYNTEDESAEQRSDYAAASGTLSFAPTEISQTLTVLITDDLYPDDAERFRVRLSNATSAGAGLGTPSQAFVTITDNDPPTNNNRHFTARLAGAQVVPPFDFAVIPTGSASGALTLNETETQAIVNLSQISGLSSAQTAAHIHGPGLVGSSAPILFSVPNGVSTINVTPAQVADLRAGRWYFDIHTANHNANGELRGQIMNALPEDPSFFVLQQYADFLSREPDTGGGNFWTQELVRCGNTPGCNYARRRWEVSNAFFFELEYQRTAAYVFRLYRAAYGNTQAFPNPNGDQDSHAYCQANPNNCILRASHVPSYQQYAVDRARINADAAQLAATQRALATAFSQRPEFVARYVANLTGPQFVDAVLANIQASSGVNLASQRDALITQFNSGGRGAVLYRLADDNEAGNPINNRALIDAEYNRTFVTTQYFGYLRRDADMPGLNFWRNVINLSPPRDVNRQLGMVCAFITSAEYQQRFGAVSPRGNGECP